MSYSTNINGNNNNVNISNDTYVTVIYGNNNFVEPIFQRYTPVNNDNSLGCIPFLILFGTVFTTMAFCMGFFEIPPISIKKTGIIILAILLLFTLFIFVPWGYERSYFSKTWKWIIKNFRVIFSTTAISGSVIFLCCLLGIKLFCFLTIPMVMIAFFCRFWFSSETRNGLNLEAGQGEASC